MNYKEATDIIAYFQLGFFVLVGSCFITAIFSMINSSRLQSLHHMLQKNYDMLRYIYSAVYDTNNNTGKTVERMTESESSDGKIDTSSLEGYKL